MNTRCSPASRGNGGATWGCAATIHHPSLRPSSRSLFLNKKRRDEQLYGVNERSYDARAIAANKSERSSLHHASHAAHRASVIIPTSMRPTPPTGFRNPLRLCQQPRWLALRDFFRRGLHLTALVCACRSTASQDIVLKREIVRPIRENARSGSYFR